MHDVFGNEDLFLGHVVPYLPPHSRLLLTWTSRGLRRGIRGEKAKPNPRFHWDFDELRGAIWNVSAFCEFLDERGMVAMMRTCGHYAVENDDLYLLETWVRNGASNSDLVPLLLFPAIVHDAYNCVTWFHRRMGSKVFWQMPYNYPPYVIDVRGIDKEWFYTGYRRLGRVYRYLLRHRIVGDMAAQGGVGGRVGEVNLLLGFITNF